MEETTNAILSRMSKPQREALERWIKEDRPDFWPGEALRYLACDSLVRLGMLDAKEAIFPSQS